jgi:hypothetical protein
MDVNDLAAGSEKIRQRWDLPANLELQPGRQFVSAGDCAAVITLARKFERHGLQTAIIKAHDMVRWSPSEGDGLIILGNSRIVPWLADTLEAEQFDLRIEANGIRECKKNVITADDPSAQRVQGIVCRTLSRSLIRGFECCLTVIAANHGRFNECFADYLFSEENLPFIFGAMQWNDLKQLPQKFDFKATVDVDLSEEIKIVPGSGATVAYHPARKAPIKAPKTKPPKK